VKRSYGVDRHVIAYDGDHAVAAYAAVDAHGHSAGATDPSLVVLQGCFAIDCDYHRSTAEDKTLSFGGSEALQQLIKSLDKTVQLVRNRICHCERGHPADQKGFMVLWPKALLDKYGWIATSLRSSQ